MSKFFDSFFVVVAVLVAAMTAIDWLVGRDGRARMKQAVGDLWTTLQYSTIDDLLISFLRPVRELLNKIYGDRAGIRLLTMAFITNWIVIEIVAAVQFYTDGLGWNSITSIIVQNYTKLDFAVQLVESLFLTVLIAGWIPFKWLVSTFNAEIHPGAAVIDWSKSALWLIAKIAAFSVLYFVIFAAIFAILSYSISYAFAQVDISMIGSSPDELANLLLRAFFIFFLIGLTSIIPIVLVFILFISLLVIRSLRPWLQPATMLLLQRLYESDKGVLTQIAIGLGFVTKLIQEIYKYATNA